MTDDATIAEFLDDADDGDASVDVDPARSTYAWGIERNCDDCGERAERWWRDGEGVVCPNCKDW